MENTNLLNAVRGSLIGGAAGDALGYLHYTQEMFNQVNRQVTKALPAIPSPKLPF